MENDKDNNNLSASSVGGLIGLLILLVLWFSGNNVEEDDFEFED